MVPYTQKEGPTYLNFHRYIWCLSGDVHRKKWWLGHSRVAGPPIEGCANSQLDS